LPAGDVTGAPVMNVSTTVTRPSRLDDARDANEAAVEARRVEQVVKTTSSSSIRERFLKRLGETRGEWLYSADATPPFRSWSSTPLGKGYLHVSAGTRIEALNDGLMIGEWARIPEAASVPSSNVHDIARLTHAGQFAVLSHDRISSDPGCLKPVFYHEGRRLAASSPRLLVELTGATLSPIEVLHGSRPDWLPGPGTRAAGVKRLLTSQQLSLADFRPVETFLVSNASSPRPIDEIAAALRSIFRGFRERGDEVWIGLTGGYDSRALLAAAVAEGVDAVAFTFAGTLVPDETELARRIADLAGVPHRVLGPAPIVQDDLDYFVWQSIGQCAGLDGDICASGLYRKIPPEALVIRGYGGEFGRQFYYKVLPDNDWFDFTDRSQLYMRLARPWVRGRQPGIQRAFEEWLDWVATTPFEFDPRDRLYLEQRIGVWAAGNEQALSATQRRRINPFNADYLYARMNLIPGPMKQASEWQKEVIKKLAPQLLEVPYYNEHRLQKLSRFASTIYRGLQFRGRDRRVRSI
jgi:hypothetical protein